MREPELRALRPMTHSRLKELRRTAADTEAPPEYLRARLAEALDEVERLSLEQDLELADP